MAAVPYAEGVPDTAPDARLPDDYQRVSADPSAFGGAIAQGAQQLGQGATRAASFFGQVAADNAANQFQDFASKLLYGDPNKAVPGPDGAMAPDTGYLGLKGRAALDARPQIEQAFDTQVRSLKDTLQTPEQQLQFDNFSKRYRAQLTTDIGRHAVEQSGSWFNEVNAASATHALNQVAINADNPPAMAAAAADLIHSRMQDAQVRYGDALTDDIKSQVIASAKQDALKTQLEAISVKDPARAMTILDRNRAIAGTSYESLANQFRPRAEEQQSYLTAQNSIAQASKASYSNPALPIFTTAAAAAPGGMSPEGLSRTVQIESRGDPSAVNPSGHAGLGQFNAPTWARFGQGSRTDPQQAILATARYSASNAPILARVLGRQPSDAELYLAHQQGPGGAAKLLANPTKRAGDLVGDRSIRANGGDPNAPASAFTSLWTAKFNGPGGSVAPGSGQTMTMPAAIAGMYKPNLSDPASFAAVDGTAPLAPPSTMLEAATAPASPPVAAVPIAPSYSAAAGGAPGLAPIGAASTRDAAPDASPAGEREMAIASVLNDPNLSPRVRDLAYSHVVRHYSEVVAANATQTTELRQSIPDIVAAAEAGVPNITFPEAQVRSMLPPAEAQRAVEQFAIAQHVGSAMAAVRYAAPQDVASMQADIASGQGVLSEAMRGHARSATTGPGAVGAQPDAMDQASFFRMREGAARRLNSEIERRNSMLVGPTADPAAYVAQAPTVAPAIAAVDPRDPASVQRMASASLAMQDYLGVPPEAQHVLMRGQAEGIAAKITAPGGDARQQLNALAQQYGDAYPKVFSDLVSLGRLPSAYQSVAALDAPNGQLMSRALQEAPGSGEYGKKSESWDQRIVTATGATDAPTKLKAAVNSSTALQSFLSSMKTQGVSAPQIDSVTRDVSTLAMAKVYWNKMDVASAADSAVDAFTGRFAFTSNGSARIPSEIADAVQSDAASTLRGLDPSKVAVPPGFGGIGQPSRDDYVNTVRAAPNWINAPKADGLLLLDQGGRLVRTPDGRPLTIPFAHAGWSAATAPAAPQLVGP